MSAAPCGRTFFASASAWTSRATAATSVPPRGVPGADITLARVLALYPEPVAFLRAALGDAAPRRRLRAISLLDRPRRIAAAARLEQILLRKSAPAAAFGTPAIPQFFSERVGCRTSSAASIWN